MKNGANTLNSQLPYHLILTPLIEGGAYTPTSSAESVYTFILNFDTIDWRWGLYSIVYVTGIKITKSYIRYIPINIPLSASTGPVLGRCYLHQASTGPVPADKGMFTGI